MNPIPGNGGGMLVQSGDAQISTTDFDHNVLPNPSTLNHKPLDPKP